VTLLLLLAACTIPDILVDETVPVPCDARAAYYQDADGDGLGNPAEAAVACEQPEGYVAVAGDCDDADPAGSGCDTGTTGTDTGPDDTGGTTGPDDTATDTGQTGA